MPMWLASWAATCCDYWTGYSLIRLLIVLRERRRQVEADPGLQLVDRHVVEDVVVVGRLDLGLAEDAEATDLDLEAEDEERIDEVLGVVAEGAEAVVVRVVVRGRPVGGGARRAIRRATGVAVIVLSALDPVER